MAQCQILEWQHCALNFGAYGSVPGTGMAKLLSEICLIWLSARYWNGSTAVWMLTHMAQCQVLECQHCSLNDDSVPGTGMAKLQSECWHKRLSAQYKHENAPQCTAQSNNLSYYNFSNLIFNLPFLNIIPSLPLNTQQKPAPCLWPAHPSTLLQLLLSESVLFYMLQNVQRPSEINTLINQPLRKKNRIF